MSQKNTIRAYAAMQPGAALVPMSSMPVIYSHIRLKSRLSTVACVTLIFQY